MAPGIAPDAAAYDILPDGLLIADDVGRIVVVNAAAQRLIGSRPEALLGLDYRKVLPLTDASGRDWWACTDPYGGLSTRTGSPENTLLFQPADGPLRELLVTARYVRDRPAGRAVQLVIGLRGTSARRRSERERADLVSTFAHELRSPLTSVKGFAATMLAKWERFSDEQKKLMLQTINSDADRVTQLITELLDVSRMESGRLELRCQLVDVPDRIRHTFASQGGAGEPPDRFRLRVLGPLPEVWADQGKIDQILGNLVENAVRHGAGTVEVSVTPAGDGVELVVTDEGGGIAAEVAPRLFTKFWRAGHRGGTGLGLYITRGLVEAHGGTIKADNAPDGGARFRVRLPAGSPPYPNNRPGPE
ncbi:MAG: PAS domain-containing sensor histidine kinase [Frankiaceae bacterium]